MTAVPAHPAIRLPVRRLAPAVLGAAGVAAGLGCAAAAVVRPEQTATAAVAAGSVVVATGVMYAILAMVRFRHLLTLTTAFMGLSMARLLASVAVGLGYMLSAGSQGVGPDKFVFGAVFLGVWTVVLGVETPMARRIVAGLGAAGRSGAATPGASGGGS